MILLLLKMSIVILIALLFYKIVIEKESFFTTNRIYLILGLILTFALPFVTLPKLIENQGVISNLIETNQNTIDNSQPITINTTPIEVFNKNEPIDSDTSVDNRTVEVMEVSSQTSFTDWLFYGYLFGVIILSINLISQVLSLLIKIIRSKDKIRDTDGTIINSSFVKEPCSFFNYIFINPDEYEYEIYEQIIAHEKIHVKKRHTIDLLLSEIAVIFLWFNPFIWLFRKEVEKNIEYQTDNLILDTNTADKDSYQMNLLKIATFNKPLTITTNYNQSLIKQRILKMNTKRSNPHSYWKYAFAMPLFFMTLLFLNKPYISLARENRMEIQSSNGRNTVIEANNSECKALIDAVRSIDINSVKAILNSTNVNCIDTNPGYDEYIKKDIKWQIEKAKTPLSAAARTGNVEMAKLLIFKGAEVNRNIDGEGTPLIVAAAFDHLNLIKYFYAQGVDLNSWSPKYGNALIIAANKGHIETVQFLIVNGAKADQIFPRHGSALIAASNNGHIEIVKYLLAQNVDINAHNDGYGSALVTAARNGYDNIVALLIENGININAQTKGHGTALVTAAKNGHLNTVKLLIERGADVNLFTNSFGTALAAASKNKHNDIVTYLISKGAKHIYSK